MLNSGPIFLSRHICLPQRPWMSCPTRRARSRRRRCSRASCASSPALSLWYASHPPRACFFFIIKISCIFVGRETGLHFHLLSNAIAIAGLFLVFVLQSTVVLYLKILSLRHLVFHRAFIQHHDSSLCIRAIFRFFFFLLRSSALPSASTSSRTARA